MRKHTFLLAALLAGCGHPTTAVRSMDLRLIGGANPTLAVAWTTTDLPSPRLSVFALASDHTAAPLLETRIDARFFGSMVGFVGGRSPRVLYAATVNPNERYALGFDQSAEVYAARPALVAAAGSDYVGAERNEAQSFRDDGSVLWRLTLDAQCPDRVAVALCVAPDERSFAVVQRDGGCSPTSWRYTRVGAGGNAMESGTFAPGTAFASANVVCALDEAGHALVALSVLDGTIQTGTYRSVLVAAPGTNGGSVQPLDDLWVSGVAPLASGFMLTTLLRPAQYYAAYDRAGLRRVDFDGLFRSDDWLGDVYAGRPALARAGAGPVLAYATGDLTHTDLTVRWFNSDGDEQGRLALDLGGLWTADPSR